MLEDIYIYIYIVDRCNNAGLFSHANNWLCIQKGHFVHRYFNTYFIDG